MTTKTVKNVEKINALVSQGLSVNKAIKQLKLSSTYFKHVKNANTTGTRTEEILVPTIEEAITLKVIGSNGTVIFIGPKSRATEALAPYLN